MIVNGSFVVDDDAKSVVWVKVVTGARVVVVVVKGVVEVIGSVVVVTGVWLLYSKLNSNKFWFGNFRIFQI